MKRILPILIMLYFFPGESRSQYFITGTGSRVIMTAGSRLIISNSNLTNNGTMELDPSSNVELKGSTAVTVSGSSEITFGNLEINNSGDVTIDKTINISTNLNFNLGNFISSANKFVSFNSGSGYSNVKNTSFVNGPVQKIGSGNFEFPIGKNSVFRKSGISGLSGSDTYVSEYFQDFFWDHSVSGAGIDHVGSLEYWTLSRTGATSATVLLSWNSASGVASGFHTDLIVARYNGTDWISNGGKSHTGDYTAGTLLSNAALTSFDYFTLGSATSNNPLPIVMKYFDLACDGGSVEILWETASEVNNDYFSVEKSRDAVNFDVIKIIPGSGNSSTPRMYRFIDTEPSGSNYYRIKQTDFDGNFKYFPVKAIDCGRDNSNFSVLNNSNSLFVEFYAGHSGSYQIKVYDSKGQAVKESDGLAAYGMNKSEFDKSQFSNGVYLVQLVWNNRMQTKKILIAS